MTKAHFTKEKQNEYGLKKRTKRFECRISDLELEQMDRLVEIFHKRRNVGKSRMDMIAYLMNNEEHKQDKIKLLK